jgi:hypothetical protein
MGRGGSEPRQLVQNVGEIGQRLRRALGVRRLLRLVFHACAQAFDGRKLGQYGVMHLRDGGGNFFFTSPCTALSVPSP